MGFTEKFDFRELCKKPKYRGTNWLKEMGTGGGLWQFSDLWEAWQKRGRAGVFEGRLIPQCTHTHTHTHINIIYKYHWMQELGVWGTSSGS